MPRPPRADEAGGLYHALNRGNLRATIFHKDEDFEAFERILSEALQIYQVELFSYQLMPNHYHRGHWHGFPDGSSVSIRPFVKPSWQQCECQPSVANR